MSGFDSKRNAAADKLGDDDLTIAYMSGYYDGKKAAQPAQESLEELFGALHRIYTAAAGLPTFEVRHEGGLDAFVQNIVDAIVALHEQRTCVGLTNEERAEFNKWVLNEMVGVAHAIEQALKEKNT